VNGRVKRFETESEAWKFFCRCDAAGKNYTLNLGHLFTGDALGRTSRAGQLSQIFIF
jgi:hypothetical protein